jgi:hypothetical protein
MARAGYTGGEKMAQANRFLNENAPLTDIVRNAEKGQQGLAQARSIAYQNEMAPLLADPTVHNFAPIANAMNGAKEMGTYHGHVVNPAAVAMANKLDPIIKEWSGQPYANGGALMPGFDPADAHTVAGLDALKKRIGVMYDKIPLEAKQERAVLDKVYGNVRNEITKQNPVYGDIMERDIQFQDDLANLKKELSMTGKKGNDGTVLRKLLAVPRNNANTNYGARVTLAKMLEDNGADNLMTQLNGAALNSFKPRGIGGAIGTGTVGALGYGLTGGNPAIIPATLGMLAMQSPKLMGNAAMKTGQLSRRLEQGINNRTPNALRAAALAQLLNSQGQNNE